jgi:hypothetical protein
MDRRYVTSIAIFTSREEILQMKTFITISVGVAIGLVIADLVTEGEAHRRIFHAVSACLAVDAAEEE